MKYSFDYYVIVERVRKGQKLTYYSRKDGFVDDIKNLNMSDLYTSKESAQRTIICGSVFNAVVAKVTLKIST